MGETAGPAEAGDDAVQDSTKTALGVAQAVHVEEPPQTREGVSLSSSPDADSESSAKSRPLRRKRTSVPSIPEPEPEKPKKRSTADRVQEELLAKTNQLIDAIVTVDDIIFARERFALVRDSIATREDRADDTDHHEPQ